MNNTALLTASLGMFGSQFDLKALEAKLRLYALQGVAYARLQAIQVAQSNLGKLIGPDQEKIAVAKGMDLYRTFEANIPMLNATLLDDMIVEQLMTKAVHEAFALVQGTLDNWTQQATTPPMPAPEPVPSVPDTNFPAPVVDDSTLPAGGLQ
ncbi:hypothetical protein EHF33_20405 (plasmid) [Deinococcus psychrotolerans]|uniref:Uncharacterized protein n=1 Tax=Deinococcus psychrotolerans TaxID=2489213 RepID=A0A3G8YK49_9DEIO|nr:hypothetical protein [Deinococcus psychrotolerans]AZI45275.1 hypothetical protein EHF33_20405 [Deinococcus psychrotolerans]